MRGWTMGLGAALLVIGCGGEERAAPVEPPPALDEAPAEPPVAEAPPEPAEVPTTPAPTAGEDEPVAMPCRVVLTHTTYDEETRAPTRETHVIPTLVAPRGWTDELRERDWADVAPMPYMRSHATESLPDAEATEIAGEPTLMAEVGDGMQHYFFDDHGRTARVIWDPTADSSDYDYAYEYECDPPVARDALPRIAAP